MYNQSIAPADTEGPFDRCVFFNVNALARTLDRIWKDAFGRVGLSPSHGYLLSAIAAVPGRSQKELCQTMALEASTITRFVDALCMKGLVSRSSVGKGGTLRVTSAGKATSRAVEKVMDQLYADMQVRFGAAPFAQFVDGLRAMRMALTASDTE